MNQQYLVLQISAKIVTFFMYQIFYVGTSCVELSCFGAFNSNQNFPRITLIQIMVTQRNGVAAFCRDGQKIKIAPAWQAKKLMGTCSAQYIFDFGMHNLLLLIYFLQNCKLCLCFVIHIHLQVCCLCLKAPVLASIIKVIIMVRKQQLEHRGS